jgi:predicted ATPase
VPSRGGDLRLRRLEVLWDDVADRAVYPYSIPALRDLERLDLPGPVTFLTGENGSGKSTLVEAIAIAAGINPGGGSRNLRSRQHATESSLGDHLRLVWGTRPETAFLLRAETFFDTASAFAGSGTHGLHEQSHGEQFLDAAATLIYAGGFCLMDEPESALSVIGQLGLLRRIHELVGQDTQFVIATHSPVLLAYPGATIYRFDDGGIAPIAYEESEPYTLTKSFLEAPERYLQHLFADE